MYSIDLNSDLGESFGSFKVGQDDQIIPLISSANVACGFHAGDYNVMNKTLLKAKNNNIAVGAHPGYYDIFGFGRRETKSSPDEVYNLMVYQIGAMQAFCKVNNIKLQHVKPHGALYNTAAKDHGTADAICNAIYDCNPSLIVFGLSGSSFIDIAKSRGLNVAQEVFADRNYMADGSLTPRSMKNAVIHDSDLAIKRVIQMVKEGTVEAVDGSVINLNPDTVCVHGDNPSALLFVQTLKKELELNDIALKAVGEN